MSMSTRSSRRRPVEAAEENFDLKKSTLRKGRRRKQDEVQGIVFQIDSDESETVDEKKNKRKTKKRSKTDAAEKNTEKRNYVLLKKKDAVRTRNRKNVSDSDTKPSEVSSESFHSAAGSPSQLAASSETDTDNKPQNDQLANSSTSSSLLHDVSSSVIGDTGSIITVDSSISPQKNRRETYSMSPKKEQSTNSKLPKSDIEMPKVKREGTFTKESSDHTQNPETPCIAKRSLSAPGSTPYHPNGQRVTRTKSNINCTDSAEKQNSIRRSKSAEGQSLSNRQTKVMFCSPVFLETIEHKRGSKIIKSSIKGSHNSFIYGDSGKKCRKRSLTENDIDEEMKSKRKRLTLEQMNSSSSRLSKPKTLPAAAGKENTPQKAITSSTSIKKQLSRSKLPDFASLHKKQFEQMDSLVDFQERKAKRALKLFGSGTVEKRRSPRGQIKELPKTPAKETPKIVAKKIANPASTVTKTRPSKIARQASKIKSPAKTKSPGKTRSPGKSRLPKIVEPVIRKKSPAAAKSPGHAKTAKIVKPVIKKKSPAKTKSSGQAVKPPKMAKTVSKVKSPAKTKSPVKATSLLGVKPLIRQESFGGYTRFGFKLNAVNPFSVVSTVPDKSAIIVKPVRSNTCFEMAKQTVMREAPSAAATVQKAKCESRNMLKGVRTNRRFELQMKMRNNN